MTSKSQGGWHRHPESVYCHQTVYERGIYDAKRKTDARNPRLKLRGYSINEIVRYYEERSQKPPSLPTIRKYYQMDNVPEVPNQNLIKDKAFDHEPYRSAIIEIIRNNKSGYYVSSIHDVLIERFVENGTSTSLPGNEQTLRNYIHLNIPLLKNT